MADSGKNVENRHECGKEYDQRHALSSLGDV